MSQHLAQMNCAVPRYERDDPRFAGFVDHLDEINALGDAQPGWVWRMTDNDQGQDAMALSLDDAPGFLFNITVWQSVEALHAFAYRSRHVEFFKRRDEWFVPQDQATTVLWWVPWAHRPDIAEGWGRLMHLRAHGPTPKAFTFQKRFAPPG